LDPERLIVHRMDKNVTSEFLTQATSPHVSHKKIEAQNKMK
jgi:hypothetical protein